MMLCSIDGCRFVRSTKSAQSNSTPGRGVKACQHSKLKNLLYYLSRDESNQLCTSEIQARHEPHDELINSRMLVTGMIIIS